jgi:hypothetical protein
MHWCADETQAVLSVLSTVDVVWLWLRALLGRALRFVWRYGSKPACECGHAHQDGGSTV